MLVPLLLLASSPAAETPSALLDGAEAAYFSVRLEEASRLIDRAEALLEREAEMPPEKPRALLLRAAVRLKSGDAAGASTAARAALFIDPDLRAGPSFPPSLDELLEATRASLPSRVAVTLTGLPAGSEPRIDGRPVPAEGLSVVPGPHRVTVRASGYQPFARSFEAKGARMSLPVSMAPLAVARVPTPSPAGTPIPTPPPRSMVGPGLLALSAASLAGGGMALYDLSVSLGNKSQAASGVQKGTYDPEIQRFEIEAAVGLGAAAVTAVLGVRRLRAPRMMVEAVPTERGPAVFLTGSF